MWMFGQPIENIILGLIVRLFIVTTILPLHEMAHGLAASWLGDDTARLSGRLTLNPLAHLDIFGTLCIFLFGFGWANPVPVNPYNFKNRKGGMALTALAGPVSNLIAAFVGILLYEIFMPRSAVIVYMFSVYISVNISLAVFNLIPIPPLDGSRILGVLIPDRYMQMFYQYERYIIIAVMVMAFAGIFDVPLKFLSDLLFSGMVNIAEAIVGIFR